MSSNSGKSPAREQWGSQFGFLMAAIGSAIGLGNIWRFPGVTYSNGGGAFMIPYVVALLTAGVPFLLLDYAVGHRYRGSSPAVFRRMSKRWEWLGWWHVVVCFVIMTYYAVIIGWSLRYTFYSVNTAWDQDKDGAKDFFFNKFLHVAGTVDYNSSPVWNVVIPLIVVWAIVIAVIGKGVAGGVERANKVFLPLLVLLFVVLVVRALFLPGAVDGLNALWTPNFDSLGEPKVWVAAYSQIFYSLSIGFGIMLTYASYLPKKTNLVGTGLVAAFANSSFEVLAGFGVFGTLGFMAHQQGVGVNKLEGLTGISLSFITFPTIINEMPGGALFGILFFLSLTLAGITSLISLLQVVGAAAAEKMGTTPLKAALVVGIPAAVVSVFVFGTTSGVYSLDVVDAYINQVGVLSSAIIMSAVTGVILRKLPMLRKHLNKVSDTKFVGQWWIVIVGAALPILLAYMMGDTVLGYIENGYNPKDYSRGFEGIFGWGMLAVSVVATIALTWAPWRTNVDSFVAQDEEGTEYSHAGVPAPAKKKEVTSDAEAASSAQA